MGGWESLKAPHKTQGTVLGIDSIPDIISVSMISIPHTSILGSMDLEIIKLIQR